MQMWTFILLSLQWEALMGAAAESTALSHKVSELVKIPVLGAQNNFIHQPAQKE